MRWPAVAAVVSLLASCSLLFDPGQVPAPCGDEQVEAPAWLEGIAGEARGRITWAWPPVRPLADGGPVAYQLCLGVDGGQGCTQVTCTGPQPCASPSTGLPDSVLVQAELRAVDGCGNRSPPALARMSPLDTSGPTGWFSTPFLCGAVTPSFAGGVITLDQAGIFCSSSYVTGDPSLSSFTLEAEIRSSTSSPALFGGFAVHETGSSRMSLVSRAQPTDSAPFVMSLTGRGGPVASATWPLTVDWQAVRVVVADGTYSFSAGPVGGPLREVVRWRDGTERTGRVGLAASGEGRFDVRALRLRSRAELPPDAGDPSVRLTFGASSSAVFRGSGPVPVGPCPALPAACASCAPGAQDSCATVARFFPTFPVVSVEQSPGLDGRAGYRVSARFAFPADAGADAVTRIMDLSSGQSLLALELASTTALGTPVGPRLASGTWHLASIEVNPDGGTLVSIDGAPAVPGGVADTQHPGAVLVGNVFNTVELYLHELSITPR